MIILKETNERELSTLSRMERQPHARNFLDATSLAGHQKNFSNPDIIYLSIVKEDGAVAGYIILGIEKRPDSVEFRRVVIDKHQIGIGQTVIKKMESYCKTKLYAKRICLDVYEDNAKAIYVYEKLGYRRFKTEKRGERLLHFYDKKV